MSLSTSALVMQLAVGRRCCSGTCSSIVKVASPPCQIAGERSRVIHLRIDSMNLRMLNYASPHLSLPRRRWLWRMLSILAAVSFLAVVAPSVAVRQDESRIDAVTGSMISKTVWLFGITSGPHVDVSPLETRLNSSGIQWAPSWQFLHNTHRNVFGGATCHECGWTPAIYQLTPMLKEFAAVSTDAELRAFVRVMQSGTDAEREAAVEAAGTHIEISLGGAVAGK